MKKIDTSFITPIAGMPLKSGGLDHLQSAYQEGIQQMAIPLIGKQYKMCIRDRELTTTLNPPISIQINPEVEQSIPNEINITPIKYINIK